MIYCYICDECGETMEKSLLMTNSQYRPNCPQCRARMRRDLSAEQGHMGTTAGNYPMESDAAGVHPAQVAETIEFDRRHSVPTEYTSEGNPVFTSREHRKKYCKAHGLYDRNAGYGDAAPTNSSLLSQKKKAEKAKQRSMEFKQYLKKANV